MNPPEGPSDVASSNPDARRDTPLARLLKAEIAAHGPMPLADYFRRCMLDPVHGYYAVRAGVGGQGDFITAPEISQVFGELIGLWCAVVWQRMGSPSAFVLLEWGPGRGTMMSDALRAARIVPGFMDAARVCLVETSAAFAAIQDETLARVGVLALRAGSVEQARTQLGELRDLPIILLGNEVLDTAAPTQYVFAAGGWAVRHVGLDVEGNLAWVDMPLAQGAATAGLPPASAGNVLTVTDTVEFDRAVSGWPSLAGVFIDYGSAGARFGDTLQAVRRHAYEHPLCSPGEADLTTLVDFAGISERVAALGLAADGPTTQAEFLGRLGIVERASRLMGANPERAGEIEAAVLRLIAPNGMGTRFKAIGVRTPDLPPLPGFPIPVQ